MATATVPLRPGVLRSRVSAARFAWLVVGYNVFVALWGAVVRATQSGAGCGNNWPLCNGQVLPISPTWHTIIEFIHRQSVTVSVLLLILMIVWTYRSTVRGQAARVFVVLSTVLLLNEAFLGAVLVLKGYVTGDRSLGRVFVLCIHFSNTLLMLAAMALTAVMLGSGQRWSNLKARGKDAWISAAGLLATLVVGVSGSMAALGDTLFPASSLRAAFAQDLNASSPWLLRLRGVHPLSAFVATGFVFWLIARARREGLTLLSGFVGWLLCLQLLLGLADLLLLAPTWMQVLHLLDADLYWLALVALSAAVVWSSDRFPLLPNPKT